jgi:GDPmannose 4,6-dehydratase
VSARRALITGIGGQDGSYLAELLLEKGYEVHGLVRSSASADLSRLEAVLERIELHRGDLVDEGSLRKAIQASEPEELYNLAGASFIGGSWAEAVLSAEVNGIGVTRLLEAIRELRPETRFFQASSSDMFDPAGEVPQSESTHLQPRSPYGIAKLYAHLSTIAYREDRGLFACAGILFNHESERRSGDFVTRKVSHGAAAIKLGREQELVLGDLDVRRDWGYAPDYVEAIWRVLQQEEPDDFVIGTGASHSVRELVEHAFEHVGLDPGAHVRVDRSMLRPSEILELRADSSKAEATLGWRAGTSFPQLVRRMVDADLERLASSTGVASG